MVVGDAHNLLQYLRKVETDHKRAGAYGTAEDISDSMAMIRQLIKVVKEQK